MLIFLLRVVLKRLPKPSHDREGAAANLPLADAYG
jgi:hypothetical protein